jgi:anti-anti-sigma factor
MELKIDSAGEGILTLDGSLDIQRVGEFQGLLSEALNKAKRLVIQLEGVQEVHLTGLQLLCSAHRTFLGQKKSLVLQGSSEAFRRIVRDLGYLRHVGCQPESKDLCLWKEGEGP